MSWLAIVPTMSETLTLASPLFRQNARQLDNNSEDFDEHEG